MDEKIKKNIKVVPKVKGKARGGGVEIPKAASQRIQEKETDAKNMVADMRDRVVGAIANELAMVEGRERFFAQAKELVDQLDDPSLGVVIATLRKFPKFAVTQVVEAVIAKKKELDTQPEESELVTDSDEQMPQSVDDDIDT